MNGLLNAGSEVSRFQIIAITAFAAFLVWLALRMYRRMHADRDSLEVAERAALRATRTAELTAGLALARTPAAAIEASLQEPLHALRAECGVMFLMSSDGSRADVARSVAFLCSERAAGHVTGQVVTVAGGMEGRLLHPPG